MARDSSGPKNEPQYAGSGVPQDAADLTEVAAYAANVGNRKVGTATQMNALTGADVWPGLEFENLTDGLTYVYASGTGFAVKSRRMNAGYRAAGTDASGRISVQHNLGVAPRGVIVTLGRVGNLLGYTKIAVDFSAMDATQFTAYISRTDTGNAYANQSADFSWIAFA